MIQDIHPGSRIRILIFYPSRIPGSKRPRIWIRNTDSNCRVWLSTWIGTYTGDWQLTCKNFLCNLLEYFGFRMPMIRIRTPHKDPDREVQIEIRCVKKYD
jgi:hypothetical protein